MPSHRVLIYLLRRDLRLADNPVFHEISKLHAQSQLPFTHLLPVYVFPAEQIEVSGFLSGSTEKSPYPEARSQVGGFWRCGHHRARFLAESVWDLRHSLETAGSGLVIRVGLLADVVKHIVEGIKSKGEVEVTGLWMTDDQGVEEKREVQQVKKAIESAGKEFRLWDDQKYLYSGFNSRLKRGDLPELFTKFRKELEPLRDCSSDTLETPKSLPPLPSSIPAQAAPFRMPDTLDSIVASLHKPLGASFGLQDPPTHSKDIPTAFPFHGGESTGHKRIKHLITSGSMTNYKDTRNGLLGADFSTKLAAWLALGSITARQVHKYLVEFEDARTDLGQGAPGYGKGENKGTAAVRFELLWRDFFALNTHKYKARLFRAGGFMERNDIPWSYDQGTIARLLEGTTGMGLVDASQRELFLTGYTSNRTRQNVASFLSKHLNIDWRIGAEWYEAMLIDYDLSSNWGNWQYNSGVGNDSRDRKFNPVKQANDYDPKSEYIKTWVEELKDERITAEEAWQAWKIDPAKKQELGLEDNVGVMQPLVQVRFEKRRGGRGGGRGNRGRGGGRGGQRGRAG